MAVTRAVAVAILAVLLPGWRCVIAQTDMPAPAPASQASGPQGIDAPIDQLGDDDFKVRAAAQKKIVELGGDASAAIREVAARDDVAPEIRARAGEILREITLRPSLVSLHFNNAPPGEVYKSLYEQAQAKIICWPPDLFARPNPWRANGPGLLTVDLDGIPFWEAMRKLEEQTGLAVHGFGSEMQLTYRVVAGVSSKRVCITGPFMVTPDDPFMPPRRVSVFVEPRIQMLCHAREADLDEPTKADVAAGPAIGGRRAAVIGQMRQQMRQQMLQQRRAALAGSGMEFDELGGNVFTAQIPDATRREGGIKGKIRATVAVRQQTFEIGVTKGGKIEKTSDGRRFELTPRKAGQGEWFAMLFVENTDPPVPGLGKMQVTLVDANGNAFEGGINGSRSTVKSMDANLEFRQPANCGPPATLRVTLPVDTMDIEIPFDFAK